MSDGSDVSRHKSFCTGWLEHKTNKSGDKYRKLWVLLEGNVLFIFRTDQPCQDTQIGNLTLTKNTECTNKPGGSPSKGYKFELYTGDKVNTFRTKKSTERELWRGYILGIAKHSVPSDLDLLEQDVKQIRDDVAEYYAISNTRGNRQSIHSGRSLESRQDSGVVSLAGSIGGDAASGVSSHSSNASSTLSGGGPTQVHMFYNNDRRRSQPPPSWFVPHCSRETAEKLLERANSLEYGNTLMRESTTFLQNGSYVISRIYVHRNGSISYDHYEVIRTVGGYKVNVQNPHTPMKCLQDVMDYFITTSESGTKPIVTNDLKTLGHDVPGYATEIKNRRSTPAEPWMWPPGKDNSMEPEPGSRNYDDTDSSNQPLPSNSSKHMDGSNTMSPGILRRDSRPSATTGRKSVGWNSVVNTPPPLPQHHTYAPGSKQNRPVAPSADEFHQRQKETDELNQFDQMIDGFERSSVYYNAPSALGINGRPRSISHTSVPQPPPPPPPPPPEPFPPPPAPHTHSYINQDVEPDSVALLPVAPPPPRDPIVQSKTPTPSRPSPTSSVSSASRFVSPQAPKPPSFTSPLKHSFSTVDTTGAKHMSPNLGKSSSDGQLKHHVTSPNSPQAFPVWNDTAKKANNFNKNVPNRTSGIDIVKEHPNEDVKEGVDEQNPGGVATLRQKFNQIAISPSTPAVKKGRARYSLPVAWSTTSMSSQPMIYEVPDENVSQTTNNPYASNINKVAKTPQTKTDPMHRSKSETQFSHNLAAGRSRRSAYEEDDVVYDDTGVPVEPTTAEGRRTQFVRQSTEPTVAHQTQANVPPVPAQGPPPPPALKSAGGDRMTQRRQTEPNLSTLRVQFEGFNEDFKKKLGALFSPGPQPQVAGGGRGVPRTPTSPRNSQFRREDNEEHLYQELPDIEPDGVTYVNERYNTEFRDNT